MAREVPGEARYVVTARLVVARTPSGDVYGYRGQPVPPSIDPIQLASLLRDGMVALTESAAAADAVATATMREA